VDVPGLVMSGHVPLSTVEDDFFIFEPDRNHLIGRRTRRVIRLGDNVVVQVAKVDSAKKQVDFRLAESPGASSPATSRRQSQRPPSREQRSGRPHAGPSEQKHPPTSRRGGHFGPSRRSGSRNRPPRGGGR
jgi:ribonuclease R